MNESGAFPILFRFSRYEIESDENRLEMSSDICRRYLGIIDDNDRGVAKLEEINCKPLNNLSVKTNSDKENNSVSLDYNKVFGADEIVLDILNDDLIAPVKLKLIRKLICYIIITLIMLTQINILDANKDLFEECVVAVKAFLAEEPFREFEASMYFHR